MKKILFLIAATFLFAANLININFFPHKNNVDVLFSLDEKYRGKVVKLGDNEYYLTNIFSTKIVNKSFDNEFLKSVEISPYKDGIKIKIHPKDKIKTQFALTPEGYGIRFRISGVGKPKKEEEVKTLLTQNPAKGVDLTAYFIGLAILIILAIILFLLKKKMPKLPSKNVKMAVLMQKPIDAKNKIVLFEFNKRKYLMVIGNTNMLLDIFDEDMAHISTPKEFDEFLKVDKIDEIKNYIKNAEELKELDERI
jgi:flagellar biogenesis protein FliO